MRRVAPLVFACILLAPALWARQPATPLSPVDAPAQQTPAAPRADGAAPEPIDWASVRPSLFVTMNVRRVVGIAVLVPAITLLVLWVFHRQAYILAWVASWVAMGAMISALAFNVNDLRLDLADDRSYRLIIGRLVIAAWAVFGVMYAAFLRYGAKWFRAPARVPRATWVSGVVLAVWFAIAAATVSMPLSVILVPTFLIVSALLATSAWAYLQNARGHRFGGAAVVAIALALTAICYVAAGVIMARMGRPTPEAIRLIYFNGLWTIGVVFGMHLLIFEDITSELRASNDALEKARDELRAMAVTDPLTGCYNRRFLEEIARHELEQHRRYRLPMALLFADCDHFKAINDSRGHEMGDRVLKTIGQLLRSSIREADYAFRWGGDEFLVMLTAEETHARAKAEDIRRTFLASPILSELPEGVDLSIGCVVVPPTTEDLTPLIQQADREMYRRKRELKSA